MPNYLRNRVPGGTYFFTANLLDRRSDLLVRHIDVLRDAIRAARVRQPFHIDAWVVLPDHMHCLWTLPPDDVDYPGRWRALKKSFSKSIEPTEYRSATMKARRERGVWQRRYWEHTVRNLDEYAAYMDYIHFNPVKHGLALSAGAWPFSTFGRCVAQGLYPQDWAEPGPDLLAGERDDDDR